MNRPFWYNIFDLVFRESRVFNNEPVKYDSLISNIHNFFGRNNLFIKLEYIGFEAVRWAGSIT